MSTLISKNNSDVFQKASIINPGIELIGVINNKGRMVDSIGKTSFSIPEQKLDMFLMGVALQSSMQCDFNEDFGEVKYIITQRGNNKFISVPTGNGDTIIAVAKKDADPEKIVSGINQLVQFSQQFLGEKISRRDGR
jgi:hypothetical protein